MTFEVTDIARLNIKPGEVLLIRVPERVVGANHGIFNEIYDAFKEALPDVKVMVTTDEWAMQCISVEQADALKEATVAALHGEKGEVNGQRVS